jgi:hypothetical protein
MLWLVADMEHMHVKKQRVNVHMVGKIIVDNDSVGNA